MFWCGSDNGQVMDCGQEVMHMAYLNISHPTVSVFGKHRNIQQVTMKCSIFLNPCQQRAHIQLRLTDAEDTSPPTCFLPTALLSELCMC